MVSNDVLTEGPSPQHGVRIGCLLARVEEDGDLGVTDAAILSASPEQPKTLILIEQEIKAGVNHSEREPVCSAI